MVPGSSPGWPITKKSTLRGAFFLYSGPPGLEQHGTAEGGANNSPVGCCLVRGSRRIGMSKSVGCRSGCQSGLEQQRRRPRPAAETGRSCWGSVLIFQSPAKGLRKNQQTQPVRPDHQISLRLPAARNVKKCRMQFMTNKRHLQRFRSTKQRRRCLSHFVLICTTWQTLRRCT